MPRPERPIDPDGDVLQAFAHALRALRADAGSPGYRELAKRAHYSVTALAEAARGRKLPSLAVTLAYVRACDGDVTEWEARWREVATADNAVPLFPESAGNRAPYVGLAAFDVADSARFHGRGELVDTILDRLAAHDFVVLIGASGAGKTSVLRAGLAPKLAEPPALITPGEHPVDAYAAVPSDAAVVLVDQFEEVFTLCRDETERTRFVEVLTTATAKIVIGLRADFYPHCLRYPRLADAVQRAQVVAAPMTSKELTQAITRPAVEANCTVENVLLARLVNDAADRPGVLPLVSHALLETWRRRRGNTLTLAAYDAAGGIERAIARTAERVYTELGEDQQHEARRIFLRLTALGDGTEDTKRRVGTAELNTGPHTAAVLDILAAQRLVTLGRDTVELTHEAVISEWPRLREWLTTDRESHRVQRRLTEAARTWEELGRDNGALYRGANLAVTTEWTQREGLEELNASERAFLDASVRWADAKHAAAARRSRRVQYLAVSLAVLLVLSIGASVVAFNQRTAAEDAMRLATSRQLAAQSLTVADARPGTAMLLGVEAYRAAPTTEARGALLSMSARQGFQGELKGHTASVSDSTFSPDGRLLVTAGRDGSAIVWDVDARTRVATLTGHTTWLRAVAVSPDGSLLATGGNDDRVMLWNLRDNTAVGTLSGHTADVTTLAFSPDGRTVLSGAEDRTAILWDVASRTPLRTFTGPAGAITSAAFSADGSMVAGASTDRTVTLWDTATGARSVVLAGHTDAVRTIAFSLDGRRLVSAGQDTTIRVWDVAQRTTTAILTGHTDWVMSAAFSADGRTLATVSIDKSVRLWDTERHTIRARLTGHTQNIYAVAVNPRRPLVASAGEDGTVMLWDPSNASIIGPQEWVNDLAFDSDGRRLVTAGTDGAVAWDPVQRRPVATFPDPGRFAYTTAVSRTGVVATGDGSGGEPHDLTLWDGGTPHRMSGHTGKILDVAFSPDGQTVATAGADGAVMLWDVRSRIRTATLHGHTAAVQGVAFSPDGRVLATAGHDQTVILWDAVQHTKLATLLGHTGWVRAVAFSPDGRTLASAGMDQTVILWNATTHTQTAQLTSHVHAVAAMAFSPDSRTIALTSADHAVVLWDLATRTVSARLTGHAQPVRAAAFSPDGRTLATAAVDNTVAIWSMEPEETARRICAALRRGLSAAERQEFAPDLPSPAAC